MQTFKDEAHAATRSDTRRPPKPGLLCCGALALVAAALALPARALADGGSGRIYAIAHSRLLEARVEIEHECLPEEECVWFGEASAYAPETECPWEAEGSQVLWHGPLKHRPGTTSGRFSFEPEQDDAATICLYVAIPVEGEVETELVESFSQTALAPAPSPGTLARPSAPPKGPEAGRTPGASGRPAAPAEGRSTRASVYRPFRANGSSRLRTHTRPGYCFSGSAAAPRRDAWRCISANVIADPCFSWRVGSASVLCPAGPWARNALRIRLTRPLPRALANHAAPSLRAQPWAIELYDGRRALFSSGASSVIEGERLNYFFGARSDEGLWGFPDRGVQPWTISIAPFGTQRLSTRAAIRHVWT